MAAISFRVRRPSIFALAICFAFVGLACLYLGWCELRLRFDVSTATATVVDSRETQGATPTYEVRYHFDAKPYGLTYSFSDPVRGRDAFTSITFDAWQQANATKRLPIVYDFDDPWNNRPVQTPALTSSLTFWLTAASSTLLIALGLFRWSASMAVSFAKSRSLETINVPFASVEAGRLAPSNAPALEAFQRAGFRIDGDSLLVNIEPNITIRANGLTRLLQTCRQQKLDPLKIVATVLDTVRNQPAIRSAMQSPASTRCNVNISLNDVQVRKAA